MPNSHREGSRKKMANILIYNGSEKWRRVDVDRIACNAASFNGHFDTTVNILTLR